MAVHKIKPANRFTRGVRKTVRRFEGRELLLGLLVAAVGGVFAWVAWASVDGVPLQDRYEVKIEVAPDSPIVKSGDAVRVAGRLAGFVTEVEPHNGNVLISTELRPEFAPLGSDARANVKVRSIIYLTYVELFPGNVDDPMPEGSTIPLARTSNGVDLLEVAQLFDEEARAALQDTVVSAGVGFAGRGTDLNAALVDLGELMPDLTSQTEAVVSRDGAIARIIGGTARISRGLSGGSPDDVAALLTSGSAVVGALAAREVELGDSIELLRPFEDEFLATAPLADPLLDDAGRAITALEPATEEIAKALPQINELFRRGDELRTETIRLTDQINPVLAAATPVLRDLRPTVASIKPLLGPLRTVVEGVAPYSRDIRLAGKGLVSATSTKVPVGQTAANAVALRFAPILTCHHARDPYPEPGESLNNSSKQVC